MFNFNQIISNNKPRESQSTAEPFTGPYASMFTEKEAKRIITDYNKTLESLIQFIFIYIHRIIGENDLLHIDNQELEKKIMLQSKNSTELKRKNQEILVDQEQYETLIQEYLKQLKENKKFYQTLCEITKEKSEDKSDLLINFEEDDLIKNESNKVFSLSVNQICKDSQQLSQNIQNSKMEEMKLNLLLNFLTQQNNELKEQLNKYQLDKIAPKLCVVCGKTYNPSENTDKSCIYHPGKIKFHFYSFKQFVSRYFSCRGCGKDEYYTCCLYCGKCKQGCRIKKHLSEQ